MVYYFKEEEVEVDGSKSSAVSFFAACCRWDEGRAGRAAGRAARVAACTWGSVEARPLLKASQTCPANCVSSPSSASVRQSKRKKRNIAYKDLLDGF